MKPSNQSPQARVVPQPFSRQAGHAPQLRPAATQVAQQKTPAQSVKRPVAPPVYRPQATPKAVQTKATKSSLSGKPVVAPPVYRPQATPKAVQTKTTKSSLSGKPVVAPSVYRAQATPKAVQPKATKSSLSGKPVVVPPPVYRTQPTPRVLQTKNSSAQNPQGDPARRRPVAPAIYRPEPKTVHPKGLLQQRTPSPTSPVGLAARRRAEPPSPLSLLRPRAVQCAFQQLPREMNQAIASHLDVQSVGNLRVADPHVLAQDLNLNFQNQHLDNWLVPGTLENAYPVDEYNYDAICDRMSAFGIPMFIAGGIRTNVQQFLAANPGGDPTQQFWNDFRGNLARQQIHDLLGDPQFTGLFGRASFLRRWRNTLLAGAAVVAVAGGLYANRTRLFG